MPDPHEPGSKPQWPIVVGRFAECARAGCHSTRVINYTASLSGDNIPSGNYRLYLVADGSPSRVTLRFGSGLSGRRTLRPRDRAPVDLQTPPQAVTSDGRNLWSAGSAYQAGSVGISISATWIKLKAPSQGFHMGLCQLHYPTAPPDAAYGPQCSALSLATGSGFEWGSVLPIDDDEFIVLAYFGYHDQGSGPESIDGRFGFGAWFLSQGIPIERSGNTTFFLQTAETWE